MQFASIRDFRLNASMILRKAQNEESIVVTRRGKPVAVLIPAAEDMLEEVLRAVRGARLRASLDKLRAQAQKSGTDRLSPAAIDREIRAVRRGGRA